MKVINIFINRYNTVILSLFLGSYPVIINDHSSIFAADGSGRQQYQSTEIPRLWRS